MTTATIERKINQAHEYKGPFFKKLALRLFPRPIQNKRMHDLYLGVVNYLMERMANGEFHGREKEALDSYIDSVAHFIEEYEKQHFPTKDVPVEEMLEFLMEQSRLTQEHLAQILKTSQPVVSDILNGKRRLTSEHIERLSLYFKVSPALFYPQTA